MPNRRFFGALLLPAVAGIATHSQAQVVTVFPEGVPKYFSGTNCVASGRATGADFVQIRLFVNNTLVKIVGNPEDQITSSRMDVRATLDSTHFFNTAAVQVRCEADYFQGYTLKTKSSTTSTVIVKNRAQIYGRYDLDVEPLLWTGGAYYRPTGEEAEGWKGTPWAAILLQQMRYDVSNLKTNLGWKAADLTSDLKVATVFYVNTHGSNGAFESDRNDWNYPWPLDPDDYALQNPSWKVELIVPSTLQESEHMDFYSVLKYRKLGMAMPTPVAPWPPFNTGSPPISLAFIDGCKVSYPAYEQAFLYPGRTHYDSTLRNQAVCAYNIDVLARATKDVATAFFTALRDGNTVREARRLAFIAYQAHDSTVPSAEAWMTIYGDDQTRIRGLYTGDGTTSIMPDNPWFR